MLQLMPRNFTALLTAILLAVSMVGVAVVPVAASHEGGDCSFPLTETDATGTDVTLEAAPAV
jgi:iron complex transport system substrate-binding protein